MTHPIAGASRIERAFAPATDAVTGTWAQRYPIETLSKALAVASVALILLLQLATHVDLTWTLRLLAAAGLLVGWCGAGSPAVRFAVMAIAPLAPAVLRAVTGSEGTALDVVWVAPLAAILLRRCAWSHWQFSPAWSVLLGGYALILTLAWPVLAFRELGFDAWAFADTATIVGASGVNAPHALQSLLLTVELQLVGLLLLETLIRDVRRAPTAIAPEGAGLVVGITLSSLVALYQGLIDPAFLTIPFWTQIGRATGTMLDANGYGAAAAVAGPIAVAICMDATRRRAVHALSAASLLVNLGGMWLAASRTAFIVAACASSALAWTLLRSARGRGLARGIAGGAIVIVALAGVMVANQGTNPLSRFISGRPRALMDLVDRDGYGTVAMRIVREFPWTGVGVSSYAVLVTDYSGLPPDAAQNWWRHQFAELGIFGAAPIVAWSLLVAKVVLMRRARTGDPLATPVVRASLAGLGLVSLVSQPTQHPVVLLLLFVLVAWFAAPIAGRDADPQGQQRPKSRWERASWVVVTVCAVAYAGGHAYLARSQLSLSARATAVHRDLVTGAYQPETEPDGTRFQWTRDVAHFRESAPSRWQVVRLWAAHPDIERRPVMVRIFTPCGVLSTLSLTSHQNQTIALAWPATDAIDFGVAVSRTWRPLFHRAWDERALGVAVSQEFVPSLEQASARAAVINAPACSR